MVYIIIGIIVLAVLWGIITTVGPYLIAIVLLLAPLIIAFLAFSFPGLLAMIVIYIFIYLVLKATGALKEFGNNKKEAAKYNLASEISKEIHENEQELRNELDTHCRWLGYMSTEKWRTKLQNYVQKTEEFDSITGNFALQMEKQLITQSDEWFEPFCKYVVDHPQGVTIVKMLNEVSCPQLQATHCTPDDVLLKEKMDAGSERVSKDVPAIFNVIPSEAGNIYTPTRYLLKLYGENGEQSKAKEMSEEINFDDL